jgi:alpha-tubulin suppressor-like RCC1 family protein
MLATLAAFGCASHRAAPTPPLMEPPAVTAASGVDPKQTPADPSHKAVEIALGHAHACALMDDGTVRCWGGNARGQLGDGSSIDRISPVTVKGLSGVAHLALGAWHSCALMKDGTVECWGADGDGQLGNGVQKESRLPVKVGGLAHVSQIATGDFHSCALLQDGTVDCWGMNLYGELGDGDAEDTRSPTPVHGLTQVAQLAAGGGTTCAVRKDGQVFCWGANDDGQLGDGTTRARQEPTPVKGLPAKDRVIQVAVAPGGSSGIHTCVLTARGRVLCWGGDRYGQLGDEGGVDSVTTPSNRVAVGNKVSQIALGEGHSCALTRVGTVVCWGVGYPFPYTQGRCLVTEAEPGMGGVLPTPEESGSDEPADREEDDDAEGEAEGEAEGDDDGEDDLEEGDGEDGEYGEDEGDSSDDSDAGEEEEADEDVAVGPFSCHGPKLVGGIVHAIQVAHGAAFACALTRDGVVDCWGDASRGQVANGTEAPGAHDDIPQPVPLP